MKNKRRLRGTEQMEGDGEGDRGTSPGDKSYG